MIDSRRSRFVSFSIRSFSIEAISPSFRWSERFRGMKELIAGMCRLRETGKSQFGRRRRQRSRFDSVTASSQSIRRRRPQVDPYTEPECAVDLRIAVSWTL